MAQKDSDGPSLELPSFGFGRRKRRRSEEPAAPDGTATEPASASVEPAETPARQRQAQPPSPEGETVGEPTPAVHKQRRAVRLPAVGAAAAVVVTGLLAGALLVGLTWASLRLCELARGTSSCGDPGVVLLLVVVALTVLLGRTLLAGFGVGEAGSISFLGVGLVTVIALLMSDLLLEWWMAVVVPVVAVVAFALAHWVSTAFVEPAEESPTEEWMRR